MILRTCLFAVCVFLAACQTGGKNLSASTNGRWAAIKLDESIVAFDGDQFLVTDVQKTLTGRGRTDYLRLDGGFLSAERLNKGNYGAQFSARQSLLKTAFPAAKKKHDVSFSAKDIKSFHTDAGNIFYAVADNGRKRCFVFEAGLWTNGSAHEGSGDTWVQGVRCKDLSNTGGQNLEADMIDFLSRVTIRR